MEYRRVSAEIFGAVASLDVIRRLAERMIRMYDRDTYAVMYDMQAACRHLIETLARNDSLRIAVYGFIRNDLNDLSAFCRECGLSYKIHVEPTNGSPYMLTWAPGFTEPVRFHTDNRRQPTITLSDLDQLAQGGAAALFDRVRDLVRSGLVNVPPALTASPDLLVKAREVLAVPNEKRQIEPFVVLFRTPDQKPADPPISFILNAAGADDAEQKFQKQFPDYQTVWVVQGDDPKAAYRDYWETTMEDDERTFPSP